MQRYVLQHKLRNVLETQNVDTYACITACPANSGRPPFSFGEGFFDTTRFGFSKDLTAFGQQVAQQRYSPGCLYLRGLTLVGPGFRQPQNIFRPQYGRYAGRSGFVLDKFLSSPGHGSKPGDSDYTVFAVFAFISNDDAEIIWNEISKHDWNDHGTMFVLGVPCEPFLLPDSTGLATFEGVFLKWIPGSPRIVVLRR